VSGTLDRVAGADDAALAFRARRGAGGYCLAKCLEGDVVETFTDRSELRSDLKEALVVHSSATFHFSRRLDGIGQVRVALKGRAAFDRRMIEVSSYDVAIVGSGVIGLTCAWKLAETGRRVVVFDPEPGKGASMQAAGMLAPVSEATWGETDLVELNVRAARQWPTFAAALEQAGGSSVGLRECGTLLVAYDGSDRAALEELVEFQRSLGLDASWCSPSRCRELEPMLAPGCRGGIDAPSDHQVDNRRLFLALSKAADAANVTRVTSAVEMVIAHDGAVTGVVAGDEEVAAPIVVVAAGSQSGGVGGIADGVVPPIRPVKGQIFRFRTADGARFTDRTVRALVGGRSVYLVSREDGAVVIGATQEEKGDDRSVTAGAISRILDDARRVLPAVDELELVEASSGLRPASPDNAPVVGPSAISGLVLSTGHFRHGVLLCSVSADAVVTLVETGELPDFMQPFSPARFARDEEPVVTGALR